MGVVVIVVTAVVGAEKNMLLLLLLTSWVRSNCYFVAVTGAEHIGVAIGVVDVVDAEQYMLVASLSLSSSLLMRGW